MRPLRRGQRAGAVADLQARLERLGFDVSPAERGGVFGPATEAAVRAFQQQRGLDVDGIAGEATWRELVESSWRLGDRFLSLQVPALRGDDVRDLQARLNALGFEAGKHDGIFGPQTAQAVGDLQRNLAIAEDGIVGRETIAALSRLSMVLRPGIGPRVRERERRRAMSPGMPGKRIAVDPGHGGVDSGAMGPSGEREAEITFRLAARIAQKLEAEGAETLLTRGPYDGPPDAQRAAMANEAGVDLLLSIHLNAHTTEIARGAAAYFFQHEGVASEPGEHLADLVIEGLLGAGQVDCRAHGRNYPILRDTRMPAVLVEPAFITNPEDAKALADSQGFDRIAAAIAGALRRYFAQPSV